MPRFRKPLIVPSSTPALADRLSRRRFLQNFGLGTGLLLGAPHLSALLAKELRARPLLVRQQDPYNAEPELAELVEKWITPVHQFFVRNHGNIPQIDAKSFRLRIEGLVEKPLELSLEELAAKFPKTTTAATITCAGNRRVEFDDKRISGVAWQAGAIGNAEWGGVKLAEVLKAAGLKAEAKHVWFDGGDQVKHKNETIHFGASVPLERVTNTNDEQVGVLLATTMNGQPLTAEHGAPLRAVTPGFIGARSVKWLQKILVSDKPSPNHFVAHAYKVVAEDSIAAHDATDPIYSYVLNSAICDVQTNGKLRVRGYALPSGDAEASIEAVKLSLDDGKTWQSATLDKTSAPFCWQLWSAELTKPADATHILVQAINSDGVVQPRKTPFNAKGYQYNGWHRVAL